MQGKRTTTMLWRMLWADTRALMRETIVLMVLIGLGVMLYVGLYEAYQYLTDTYDYVYRTTRLADASVLMESAPASLVDKARAIPHVKAAMGRVVKDGTIIQRGRERERVSGRFVGCPLGHRPPINDLRIIKGRYLKNGDEAILEHQFAGESGYKLGDRIKCGLAISPEYVYPIPSKFSPFVARGTFGVVFIAEDCARAWLGLGARITELHCLTEPGWDHDVLKKLEGLCHPYGVETSYVQDDQPSKRLLDMDQQGFAVLSVFFPILFLIAAGLSLYGALNRMVRLRITVIGTLKANGFGSREIQRHYVLQGLLIGVGGGVPGSVRQRVVPTPDCWRASLGHTPYGDDLRRCHRGRRSVSAGASCRSIAPGCGHARRNRQRTKGRSRAPNRPANPLGAGNVPYSPAGDFPSCLPDATCPRRHRRRCHHHDNHVRNVGLDSGRD